MSEETKDEIIIQLLNRIKDLEAAKARMIASIQMACDASSEDDAVQIVAIRMNKLDSYQQCFKHLQNNLKKEFIVRANWTSNKICTVIDNFFDYTQQMLGDDNDS